MEPLPKRAKIEESKSKELPLSDVLEWFDTTTQPYPILARDKEKKTITKFLNTCLSRGKGESIYICGSPGIGKTLLISNILNEVSQSKKKPVKVININAMSLQKNMDIYSVILEKLCNKRMQWEKAKRELEERFIQKSRKMAPLVLCIDEVDRLFTNERTIVYDLFEWPYVSSQTLIVIGIANSIDLVEKSLPLLKTNKVVQTMVFSSYTTDSLKSIVTQRISLCNESLHTSFTLFQPPAIELCCRKVSETGDARRLLDICKSALQTVCPGNLVNQDTIVSISVMSQLLSQFFRPDQQSIITDLPRMVQVLLACLCSMVIEKQESAKSFSVTPNSLKAVYIQVLKGVIGGNRPNTSEYQQLFDQLVNNGVCKVVHSTRLKPMDRPILMLMKLDVICEELERDSDLRKVLKKGWEYIK